jgi:signal transduction histidine kinase
VIAVFDSQGQLLYRQQTANTPPITEVSSSPLFAALGEERVAVSELRSPYDEVRRVYGLSRVGPTDFVIAVGVPSAILYEPMQRQFIRYLFFIFLAVVCAVVAAILMQRQIVRPIQRLSIAAHALGKGDYSVSAPVDAGGEIGDLGAAFNRMAREIKEREQRLTELDRLKSDFVSSVSHELRTPLTTISTLTHVLQRTNPTDAERREYLQTIAAECDRQIDLVTNLLDLSRIESGAYRMNLASVDAVEIIKECGQVARHGAEMRNQELQLEHPREPVAVLADKTALRRVISTLLENAIKYTADEGKIVLGLNTVNGEVCIFIKDNGSGIDSRDLPHIFERFYQGRAVNSDEEAGIRAERPGVGLGLYVVRGLVEQLGGRITVESKIGRGSTFTIYLPHTNRDDHQVTSNVETIACN